MTLLHKNVEKNSFSKSSLINLKFSEGISLKNKAIGLAI